MVESDTIIDTSLGKAKVENLVFGLQFESTIRFMDIIVRCENVTYEPEQFPGLIFRSSGTLTLFSTGAGTLTGVTTADQAREVVREFREEAQLSDFYPRMEIVTCVGSLKTKPLPLTELATETGIEYDHSDYPNATFKRSADPKFTALIQRSGHIYLMGLQRPEEIPRAAEILGEELWSALSDGE